MSSPNLGMHSQMLILFCSECLPERRPWNQLASLPHA
jgi:hypothetical protein